MAPKYHPTPVSGSHRKALAKELTRTRNDVDFRAARGRMAVGFDQASPEIANAVEPVQGRIHIEMINEPFLFKTRARLQNAGLV